MKVFTYSEARQNFAKILKLAQKEEVEIRRRDGVAFSLTSKKNLQVLHLMFRGSKRKPRPKIS